MATSIHLPKPLLEAIDRRARALHISRNRLIVRALERELGAPGDWSPGFLEQLATTTDDLVQGVDELVDAVMAGRRSKRPREL